MPAACERRDGIASARVHDDDLGDRLLHLQRTDGIDEGRIVAEAQHDTGEPSGLSRRGRSCALPVSNARHGRDGGGERRRAGRRRERIPPDSRDLAEALANARPEALHDGRSRGRRGDHREPETPCLADDPIHVVRRGHHQDPVPAPVADPFDRRERPPCRAARLLDDGCLLGHAGLDEGTLHHTGLRARPRMTSAAENRFRKSLVVEIGRMTQSRCKLGRGAVRVCGGAEDDDRIGGRVAGQAAVPPDPQPGESQRAAGNRDRSERSAALRKPNPAHASGPNDRSISGKLLALGAQVGLRARPW